MTKLFEIEFLDDAYEFLLAFWDKTDSENTLVIATHGFIKKRSDLPDNEILKAKQLRTRYFIDKEKLKKKKK